MKQKPLEKAITADKQDIIFLIAPLQLNVLFIHKAAVMKKTLPARQRLNQYFKY